MIESSQTPSRAQPRFCGKCEALLALLIVVVAFFPATFAKARESTLPNIIIFLVDDLGWSDTEPYGNEYYETPHLSRFSQQGMRFTQAYAEPLCSPSRAALLSGKYSGRIHMHQAITGKSKPDPIVPEKARQNARVVWPESRNHLPLAQETIAEALAAVGYETWHLGKWHLGSASAFGPQHQGFEKVIGVGGAGPRGGYFAPHQIPHLNSGPPGEYICERLTEEACRLLESRSGRPFFMYLSHFNVHSPYQARAEPIERFAAKLDGSSDPRNPVMGAMIHAVDESFGKIMLKLEELELDEVTWVFFLSDNGGVHWKAMKGPVSKRYPVPVTLNAPLRGGKCSFYEGGVRVPMIVGKPGTVVAGAEVDTPVHLIDLFPTLLDIVGLSRAEDQQLDGVSLLPLLDGSGSFPPRRLYCHFPRKKTTANTCGGSFVREAKYKLVRLWFDGPSGEHEFELYDLEEDVGETTNLASVRPQTVDKLNKALDEWLQSTGALQPKVNPAFGNL